MKQSRFTLADVLAVLTALVFGFICFLGKNFATLGDLSASIAWAVFISLSLAGSAFTAKSLKRVNCNFKRNFILEVLVLLMFTGLIAYFAYSPFPHYFNVSTKKNEIQKKLQTSIAQAENIFTRYENYVKTRENTYEGSLQTAIDSKNRGRGNNDYLNYGFTEGIAPDSIQLNHKMFTLHTLLMPPNYSDPSTKKGLKEVATNWLNKAKSITTDWSPISIVTVINEIEKNSINWESQLINLSKERGDAEEYIDFPSALSFADVKFYFTNLGNPTPITIGLAVVAYVLMSLSWLVTKRDRRRGIKTAPYEITL